MKLEPYQIIDISQPVSKATACFPGDTPFDYSLKATFQQTGCYNVTALTMSPHVGTHADAAAHVVKEIKPNNLAGNLPLAPFIGPCRVIDLAPCNGEIKDFKEKLKGTPPRILFKTKRELHFDVFDENSAYLSVEAIECLHQHGIKLVGLDTPSVDPVDSKTLDAHHALISYGIVWLENLDLSHAKEGDYFLSALPIKFMELEAAPVRAVLLSGRDDRDLSDPRDLRDRDK